jgi:hypothetical protein
MNNKKIIKKKRRKKKKNEIKLFIKLAVHTVNLEQLYSCRLFCISNVKIFTQTV